jgi:hypothetical protein
VLITPQLVLTLVSFLQVILVVQSSLVKLFAENLDRLQNHLSVFGLDLPEAATRRLQRGRRYS